MWPRIFLFLFASLAQSFETNNGVVGKPEVFCGIDTIRVKVRTDHSFNGRIYVDGESDKHHCVQKSEDTHPSQEFSIPIGACNMRRQRTLHPRGIAFSFTMIVSFHPFFVTGMDRAFSIRCFFLESIKGLNAEIDVNTLAPQNIDQEYSLPVCAYHLKDGIEGHVLRFAQVGQKVTHLWRCDQDASHVYGILIHSCYADDGHGNKFELVDDRGCSIDPYLLPQIEYEQGAISAFTHAHVFKYADKIQLYFTCTVQLCYKHDGGCEGITPPKCSSHGGEINHPSFGHHNPNSLSSHAPPPHSDSEDNDPHGSDEYHPTPPSFVHLEEPFEHGPPTGKSSFQPIILGHPNPTVFSKDQLDHSVPPFKGPKDVTSHEEEPTPYRRDSPINETDDEIMLQVVTLRTTVPVPSKTPELVTFKPVSTSSIAKTTTTTTNNTNKNNDDDEEEDEETIEKLTTDEYRERFESTTQFATSSTKVRRTAGDMETDVTADVIVLPVEDKERKDTNPQPQSLTFSSSAEVCMSRTSTFIFSTAIILAIFCCIIVTFFITRRRNRDAAFEHSKRRIENF